MLGNEYQKLAMRTNDGKSTDRLMKFIEENPTIDVGGLMNGLEGLCGETGEANDMIKKAIFHQKPFDQEHFKKELGDVMWYMAMICQSMGYELDEILQMNVDKLIARYPGGFDIQRANNRAKGDV